MKITQMWKRNEPDSIAGYSITLTTIYSSMDKLEIDDLEKTMPKGMLVMDGDYKPIKGDSDAAD